MMFWRVPVTISIKKVVGNMDAEKIARVLMAYTHHSWREVTCQLDLPGEVGEVRNLKTQVQECT